jgi:hypothetical protein
MVFANPVASQDAQLEATGTGPETLSDPTPTGVKDDPDDASGHLDVEEFAINSGLMLVGEEEWFSWSEWPHVNSFKYDVMGHGEGDDEYVKLGSVQGYRVRQDWTVDSSHKLWDEADALDADVVAYVDALIRELRACAQVFICSPSSPTMAQHITILGHLALDAQVEDSVRLWRDVSACVAMMDVPTIMLVDPHAMPQERKKSVNKLKTRNQIVGLKELGFVRMVGSRFLWGWNREMSDSAMSDYSYAQLLAAKQTGALDAVLKAHISEEVYGEVPDHVKKMMGLPDPDDSMEDI